MPQVKIPLVWTHGRRFRVATAYASGLILASALICLPLAWVSALALLFGLGVCLILVVLITRKLLFVHEQHSMSRDGPFFVVDDENMTLPASMGAHVVPLSELTIRSWRTPSQWRYKAPFTPSAAHLSLVGAGLDLVLSGINHSGPIVSLLPVSQADSITMTAGMQEIEVDTGALIKACAQLDRQIRQAKSPAPEPVAFEAPFARVNVVAASVDPAPIAFTPSRPSPPAANPASRVEDLLRQLDSGHLLEIPPTEIALAQSARDPAGRTLLHRARRHSAVLALLAVQLDVNARDVDGCTPLMVHGRSAAVNRSLIAAGADLSATDTNGSNALFHQALPPGGSAGFCAPPFDALQVLLDAGIKQPQADQVEVWKRHANGAVTSAAESGDAMRFCAWIDGIGPR
jgi:hypothetical protein